MKNILEKTKKRLCIVTQKKFLNYEDNILNNQVRIEESLIIDALKKYNYDTWRCAWDNPKVEWTSFDAIIIRSPWNYSLHVDDFIQWVQSCEESTFVMNSFKTIKWNANKSYLFDLADQGIPIVPSLRCPKKSDKSLETLFQNFPKASNFIVKPIIGAGSRHTYHISSDNIHKNEALFNEINSHEDFLIQPFIDTVRTKGEVSLIYFGDTFSHATIKHPKTGDFRVQEEYGGKTELYQATDEEIYFGLNVISRCPDKAAYSRIDILFSDVGGIYLSEVEQIEPYLWLDKHPNSEKLFAKVIHEMILENLDC